MAILVTSARYGSGRFGLTSYGVVNVSKAITGTTGTGSITAITAGGFEVDITERITASAVGTGSINTVIVNVSEALGSVAGTGAVSTITPHAASLIALTGVTGTGHVNTVEEKVSEALLSVVGTGAVSGVTVHVSELLASAYVTGSIATITPHADSLIVLLGVEGTSLVNTVGVSANVTLTGVTATGQLTTVEAVHVVERLDATPSTGTIGDITVTAVVFNFEAVRTQYSRRRTVYIAEAA